YGFAARWEDSDRRTRHRERDRSKTVEKRLPAGLQHQKAWLGAWPEPRQTNCRGLPRRRPDARPIPRRARHDLPNRVADCRKTCCFRTAANLTLHDPSILPHRDHASHNVDSLCPEDLIYSLRPPGKPSKKRIMK